MAGWCMLPVLLLPLVLLSDVGVVASGPAIGHSCILPTENKIK